VSDNYVVFSDWEVFWRDNSVVLRVY
jgi:hypothetical protein